MLKVALPRHSHVLDFAGARGRVILSINLTGSHNVSFAINPVSKEKHPGNQRCDVRDVGCRLAEKLVDNFSITDNHDWTSRVGVVFRVMIDAERVVE
jgi:hypothetical protein